MLLTTHPLLVPRSWKSRLIHLPNLGHTGPVTGSLYLYIYICIYIYIYIYIFHFLHTKYHRTLNCTLKNRSWSVSCLSDTCIAKEYHIKSVLSYAISFIIIYLFNYSEYVTLLTYSIVQSHYWEANWFAASQEIPRISRNSKVHYRTHKRPPPVSIMGQPNPVHIYIPPPGDPS